MNKVNFDGLKNIGVPDEWIKKALAIPENSKQKKTPFMLTYKKAITAIVAAVVVCIMSIPLYMFEKTDVSIPVLPATETSDVVNREDLISNNSTEVTSELIGTSPATKTELHQTEVDPIPSNIVTQNKTDVIVPITHQSVPVTNTPEPTIPRPTYPSPTNPDPITTPSKTDPTEPSTGRYVSMIPSCAGSYDASNMIGADAVEEIYCCLYDSYGNLLGDSNLYSSEHIAKVMYMQNGYVFMSYEPMEKGLKLEAGTYKYYFYLSDWDVVYEGEIKVY